MTHDEAVVAYLELGPDDPDVAAHVADCPSCRALVDELDGTRGSLGEAFAWEEPPEDLADSVVAAILADAGSPASSASPGSPAPVDGPVAPVVDLAAARRDAGRWRRIARLTSAAAVVALVVAVGSLVALGTRPTPEVASDPFADAVTLQVGGTELAPGVSGSLAMVSTPSGVRMRLEAPGLPRRDGDEFYEAWLKGPDGLVPVGTFHDADEAIWLWAGVSYLDFPQFTVTEEVADGNQESSGRRVLTGSLAPPASSSPTTAG